MLCLWSKTKKEKVLKIKGKKNSKHKFKKVSYDNMGKKNQDPVETFCAFSFNGVDD